MTRCLVRTGDAQRFTPVAVFFPDPTREIDDTLERRAAAARPVLGCSPEQ